MSYFTATYRVLQYRNRGGEQLIDQTVIRWQVPADVDQQGLADTDQQVAAASQRKDFMQQLIIPNLCTVEAQGLSLSL